MDYAWMKMMEENITAMHEKIDALIVKAFPEKFKTVGDKTEKVKQESQELR